MNLFEIKTIPKKTVNLLYCSGSDPGPVLAAGVPVLQQLLQDAGLLQRPELRDVLGDDGDVAAVTVLAVRQRAEEGVVFVGGKIVPGERSDRTGSAAELSSFDSSAFNRRLLPVSAIATETIQRPKLWTSDGF